MLSQKHLIPCELETQYLCEFISNFIIIGYVTNYALALMNWFERKNRFKENSRKKNYLE